MANWKTLCVASTIVLGALTGFASAEDASGAEKPALTRPEMKQRIEALKGRTSRLTLPPPSAEEIASGRPLVNNGRLRAMYLPPAWQNFLVPGWGSISTQKGPTSTAALLNSLQSQPDYPFKTRLFWVVSRGNDCQYCLGHQELKLRRVGMTDDQIAALDGRWELFPENEQAALAVAHRLTISPHKFTDADVAKLKAFYDDREVINIIYTVARYNSVNRWTASTGIPQDRSFGGEEHSRLDTPTSTEFSRLPSKVAPLDHPLRAEWETPDQVSSALAAARSRKPVVELPTAGAAQRVLAADTPGAIPPAWFQAIADLPVALDAWRQRQSMVRDGKTPLNLRFMVAWVSARENRAWYAAGHARTRFLSLGGDEAALASFAALERSATEPGHADALRFARKLTSAPHTIVDADVAALKQHFSDHEIAEIIQVIGDANAFDRYTEALRLPLEDLPDNFSQTQ